MASADRAASAVARGRVEESRFSLPWPLPVDHDQAVERHQAENNGNDRLAWPEQARSGAEDPDGDDPRETANVARHLSAAVLPDSLERSLRRRERTGQ